MTLSPPAPHDPLLAARSDVEPQVEVPTFAVIGLREASQHVLLWQARGQTRFRVDGRVLTLTARTALWLPARTVHELTVAPNSALLPMFFDARRFAGPTATPTVVAIDRESETLCLALVASQYSLLQPPADLEQMVLALVEAQVVAPVGTVLPRSLPALRVARSVVINPAGRRSLSDWAAELHVSTRTLERSFVAETGQSWRRWRLGYRMLRAAQLLRSTPVDVTEIALRVGFGTPSAFSRAFRQHHGVTPTRYRELSQALEQPAGHS